MRRTVFFGLALGMLAVTPLVGAAIAAQGNPQGSITLYNAEEMDGTGVTITTDVPNLQSVPADEGFDGTANDYAYSIKTVGQWQVCMDAGYETSCLIVDGEMASLGDNGGSVSSVRYLGPGNSAAAAPVAATTPQSGPLSVAAKEDDWQPMYNVDLFGNDYREIAYSKPGSTWKTCKASCDDDKKCRAWTYVAPGRTEHGECFLKAPVPEASESDCCVSGVKGGASSEGAAGDAAISRGLKRLGETAADALEDEANRAVDRKVRDIFGRVIGG
ncbi:hypothetical protein LY632_13550 [Erythrobacter sp. SDW2]|uniref:PAN domain-containing protein n=1 Tax=Erythrobacter sp. SDW2 TaxID=2907154 RepID=UPI001F24DB59|nr:PAN domain-containing protein [Erythrobacter sp. SDW2]UIP06690.1 hypothetical protein LY632_13550 [Erythrobacter sp. SDW2]